MRNGAAPDAAVAAMASTQGRSRASLAYEGANVLDAPAEIWQDVRGVFGWRHPVDTGRVTYEYGMSNKGARVHRPVEQHGVLRRGCRASSAPFPVHGSDEAHILSWFDGAARWQRWQPHERSGCSGAALIAARAWRPSPLRRSCCGCCLPSALCVSVRRLPRMPPRQPHRSRARACCSTASRVGVDRVQSVMVKQSFIRRLLGYCELSLGKIDAAAENSDDQQKASGSRGS